MFRRLATSGPPTPMLVSLQTDPSRHQDASRLCPRFALDPDLTAQRQTLQTAVGWVIRAKTQVEKP